MLKLVASVMPTGREAAARDFRRAAMGGADWIELRLDLWPKDLPLAPLLREAPLPVLVACRLPRDGGLYAGSLEERRLLLDQALADGARGIDLEQWETWTPTPRPTIELVIRSCHALDAMPEDLPRLRDELLALGGQIAKLAVRLDDMAAAGPLLDLLASTDQQTAPTAAFGIGPAAMPTRVLACMLGAPLAYASLGAGTETAPGQISLEEVTGVYDLRALSGTTMLFGLLGNPARHSLSPWLHNRAFRWLGLDAVYLPFETADPARLLAALPRRRLRGLSVTAPFKEVMLKRCHQLDPAAARVQAVNTLVFAAHGVVAGYNTDVAGVRGALLRAGLAPAVTPAPAAVLGTGGGARAAVVALQELGFAVSMLGRNVERVREFAQTVGAALAPLEARVLTMLQPRVVVHATPCGSAGAPEQPARLVPEWVPERGTFVLDMVYRPAETPLLRDARAAGAVAVSGFEMFLTQAAEQALLFTGRRPGEDLLRRFVAGS